MPAPITATLGEFAAQLRYEAIAPGALEAVRVALLDHYACLYAGLPLPINKLVRDLLETRGLVSEARLYLGTETASATDAAMANCIASHCLDFDDVALRGSHPSCLLLAAIIAEAEAIGASGRDVITAYAVGYETWARFIEREQDAYLDRGWHMTAVVGPVAAAAAIANLKRLDAKQATSAIAIAASMSGGVVANFGSSASQIQVGRAAVSGISAARAAAAGMTGSPIALEAPKGLLVALSPKGRLDLDTPLTDLGTAWRLETIGLNIKKYPMALATHRPIDGMLELVAAHDLKPADVAEITLLIGPKQQEGRGQFPPEARFRALTSVELGVAAALVSRGVTLAVLEEAYWKRDDVQAVMKLIRQEVDPQIPPDREPNLGFSTRVRVRTSDGRVMESDEFPVASGHWTRRLSTEAMWGKFEGCASGRISDTDARGLFDKLCAYEKIADLKELSVTLL